MEWECFENEEITRIMNENKIVGNTKCFKEAWEK